MALALAGVRTSTIYRRLMERLPVRTPRRQIVPMRFNAAQERLWGYVAPLLDQWKPIKIIVLKARREGVSAFTEALLTATCIVQDYTQAMVVAHQRRATERIWGVSQRMVLDSPWRAISSIKGHAIGLRHSLLELATAGSPEAARSADLTALHASELAFWKQSAALLAIRQCLPQDEDAFYIEIDESTANGMVDDGELFYSEWKAACAGENGFLPVFLSWHTFPEYTVRLNTPLDDLDGEEELLINDLQLTWGQLRWRRQVLAERCFGNVDKFNQEYPATPEMAFIMSGLPFFRPAELVWCEALIEHGRRGQLVDQRGRVRFVDDPKGRLTVFRPPIPGHEYVIGADSSMGLQDIENREHSRSAAEVLDMETLEQVAEYEAPAAPHIFARDLAQLGRAYNEALLVPEINASGGGGGRELIVYLRDQYNYPNLHRWQAPDRIRQGQAIMYGWETNARTRPRMIARIREVMMERSTRIHSRALLSQLRAFGENDEGKMEALAGHDDLLFAFGIALVSRSENFVAKRQQVRDPGPQFPFDSLHMPWAQDIHDRDRGVLQEVLTGMGLVAGAQPTSFMAW